MSSLQDKAQEVVKEDFEKAKVLVSDAAKSQSYLYPIKGIFYFVSRPTIWKPLLKQILPTVGMSIAVVSLMFFFTYLPQVSILVFVNGPLAVFTTVLLILNESSTIIDFIAKNWLLKEAVLDTFDGVLIEQGETELVKEGREVKSDEDGRERLGKILKSPFGGLSLKALLRYFIYLPLNFIPVIGTIIFILIQGRNRGKAVHGRYFQLKRWSSAQQESYLEQHVGPYTAFGVVATFLEMVPFVSIFFSFTNTVGAALWAVDLENHSRRVESTAPTLMDKAKKAE